MMYLMRISSVASLILAYSGSSLALPSPVGDHQLQWIKVRAGEQSTTKDAFAAGTSRHSYGTPLSDGSAITASTFHGIPHNDGYSTLRHHDDLGEFSSRHVLLRQNSDTGKNSVDHTSRQTRVPDYDLWTQPTQISGHARSFGIPEPYEFQPWASDNSRPFLEYEGFSQPFYSCSAGMMVPTSDSRHYLGTNPTSTHTLFNDQSINLSTPHSEYNIRSSPPFDCSSFLVSHPPSPQGSPSQQMTALNAPHREPLEQLLDKTAANGDKAALKEGAQKYSLDQIAAVERLSRLQCLDFGSLVTDSNSKCWTKLDSSFKDFMIHTIHLETGYKLNGIREKLRREVTPLLATAIVSGVYQNISDTVRFLYDGFYAKEQHTWKSFLNPLQARELISELSLISGQDEDVMYHFLSHVWDLPNKAQEASKLFHGTQQLRVFFIGNNNLFKPDLPPVKANEPIIDSKDIKGKLWKTGTSLSQRRRIVAIVKAIFRHTSKKNHDPAYKILERGDETFGLGILAAETRGGLAGAESYIGNCTNIIPKHRNQDIQNQDPAPNHHFQDV
jgi:hypothetical protein